MADHGLYAQYGCGLDAPVGWVNFDVSPRLRFERLPLAGHAMRASGKALYPANVRYGDIVSGLPLADGSVRGLYCSHVLEHIDRQSVEVALRNSLRLLQPGGIFRMIVPDLVWRSELYLEQVRSGARDASDTFLYSTYLGEPSRPHGLMGRARALLGNNHHRWMYDEAQMTAMLERAGFVAIRPCDVGDCEDPRFSDVESCDRFYDSGHKELALEARRA